MLTPAEAAKNIVELGKSDIADQCLHIERLHRVIVRLERDSQFDLVGDAVRRLAQMELTLVRMKTDYFAAHGQLAQDTVDQPNLTKVEHGTPI